LVVSQSGVMFVGTTGSGTANLFRSTNNGDSWSPSSTGLGNQTISGLSIDSLGNIFAARANGVSISTDGGSTWQATATPPSSTNKVLAGSVGHIYALSTSGGLPYRSTDFGTNWTSFTVNTDFPYPNAITMNPAN